MAVLTKIKSATLIETLTASVLIVIVFMVASLSINSIVKNTSKKEASVIKSRVQQLYYLNLHNKLKLPYDEELEGWNINIPKDKNIVYYSKESTNKELSYP